MHTVIANWKMNMLASQAKAYCDTLLASYTPSDKVHAGIAPPFTLIREVERWMAGSGVKVYAQNGYFEPQGAFTGEVSMPLLRDAGCHGVILGHSERRHVFGETDEMIAPKLLAAWENDLHPVLCIGETLTQRDAGFTLDVLHQQLSILRQTGPGPLTIAYEPVWAIGTGRVATPDQIEEVTTYLNDELWILFGDLGKEMSILYGGSVTPSNFEEILEIPFVAGGLVGGASLDPVKFQQLVHQSEAASTSGPS